MRRIDADERRARLARRHRIAAEYRARDVVDATRSMVCLHATDPATVYLSARARVADLARADLDGALYADRTLIKHLSMRRTLFVFTRELLAAATAGPGARVADSERRRTISEIEASAVASDGLRWLGHAEAAVLAALESHPNLTSSQLREAGPHRRCEDACRWSRQMGNRRPRWAETVDYPVGRRARGARQQSGWLDVSRPMWTSMARWLGSALDRHGCRCWHCPDDPKLGSARFGPGTANDLKWWLGVRSTDVKRALTDVAAVEVDLDGSVGYLLPDDLDPVVEVEPWVALLPALDPTPMGWADRDWYLGPHRAVLFDSNGNAGPTAWWNGRVVGGWHQEPSGPVVVDIVERIPKLARTRLDREAAKLTDWLAGERVLPRFPSPLLKTVTAR